MTKFYATDQDLTVNSTTLGSGGGCMLSVEYDKTVNTTDVFCAGATEVDIVAGQKIINATVNGYLNTDDDTLLTALAEGTAITTWTHLVNGAVSGDIQHAATGGIITSQPITYPVDGIVNYSFTARLTGFTTTAYTP